MAYTWKWNEKIGVADIYTYDKVVPFNLYQGNGFLIFIYEYKTKEGEDMYQIHNFLLDENHAKIMFGLKADSDDIKENHYNTESYQLQEIRLNKKHYAYTKKLVDMLMKADFKNLVIELYEEDFESDKED